jgi:hypothetical protein
MAEAPIVDAEVVEPGQELAVQDQAGTLFHTDDPATVLERATDTANALKSVLREQNMIQRIQGRDHVKVEGWTTLGAMLGVTPVCVWTHPIEQGWEARVEARTLDGRIIGAAEAECLRSESKWKTRDDYAIRSMAQTRATSKALGSVLRFVVTLAGYSGTPAEEMPGEAAPQSTPPPTDGPVTKDQAHEIVALLGSSPISTDAYDAFKQWAPENLKQGPALALIETLKEDPERGSQMAAQMAGYTDIPDDPSQ